jgi:membrane protease YdiL (CAAX protease family)
VARLVLGWQGLSRMLGPTAGLWVGAISFSVSTCVTDLPQLVKRLLIGLALGLAYMGSGSLVVACAMNATYHFLLLLTQYTLSHLTERAPAAKAPEAPMPPANVC